MTKPVIQIQNLIKNYGQASSLTKVIRGLDIRIEPGEFVIVFGPSGSGKSTLLNIINGLEEPTSGSVVVDDQELTSMTSYEKAKFHREKIGMVFQAYNLISSLTIIQNITLPLVFAKVPKPDRQIRGMQLLKDFELESLANRLPTEISGGQQQRIGIMRALVNKPPIIIADEPTGNLDSVSTKTVMELFKNLNQKYKNTLIVVTHDPSLFFYADRIIHILDGKIIKETSTGQKVSQKSSKTQLLPFDLYLKKEKDSQRIKLLDILAVILNRSQLASFDETEIKLTIDFMSQFTQSKIDSDTFQHLLDKPQKSGGAGLYTPTATYITQSLENILKIIN